jgi:hypothetical protein
MTEINNKADSRLTSTDQVLSFVGAENCRFVFRRLKGSQMTDWEARRALRRAGSMLYFVEYGREKPDPLWIQVPGIKAFAPLFSPDGNWIVYSTTFFESDIFVMPLDSYEPIHVGIGAHPHWWIDPNSEDRYVVYRTQNGKFDGLPPGKTMRQRLDKDHLPIGEPEIICEHGFGGGISADGHFLATGYTHLVVADLIKGQYYQPLGDHQLADGENQVCDVSLPPDASRQVMHLRLTLQGEGRHDYFGISDFRGKTYTRIDKPVETEEWQTPEWSTHPDFATASGTRSDNTYDLYLVRISDRETLRLSWQGGYGHAHLWIPAP